MTAVFVNGFDPVQQPDCEMCKNRGLHLYRADCLRCYARDMARGVPRLERQRREYLRKTMDPEWMATLVRYVAEERKADTASGYYRTEGRS